ncbi:MAG: hypothetical protein RLZZ490_1861 [Cyanobacteriota bacterium]
MLDLNPLNLSPSVHSLIDILQWRSRHQSDQRAYTFLVDGEKQEKHLTYFELDQQAKNLAFHLSLITTPGDRALLLYRQGLDFIVAFFGCLYAGVIAVPAQLPHRRQKLSHLQGIVNNSQAQIALTTTDLLADLQDRFSQDGGLQTLQWMASDNLSGDTISEAQLPALKPEMLGFLQYTSGSTGTPKGVMVSHGNLLHNSETIRQAFKLTEASVSVTWLPSFHDMGLIDGIIQPLYSGFLGVILSPIAFVQKPLRWLQAIARYGATHSGGPNMGYELCTNKIAADQLAGLDLSHWHSAYSGAEPIRWQTLEKFTAKFAGCGFKSQFFYPCYGMAEATLMITGGTVDEPPYYCAVEPEALTKQRIVSSQDKGRRLVGCGHLWLNTQIQIVDPETLTPCPSGQVGEIWVSGGSVAQGYWKQPEQTQAVFQAFLADSGTGPFLRTGDLGFIKGEELFITGRIKDVIILWGRNLYPQDIELTVAQAHPALRADCGAAFTVEGEDGERLVIVQEVERSALKNLPVNEIVGAIQAAIVEEYEVAVAVVLLLKPATIPKTSSGKIQRGRCREVFLRNELMSVGEWRSPMDNPLTESPLNARNSDGEGSGSLDIVVNTERISLTAIEDWLIQRLAANMGCSAEEIDPSISFSRHSLDSSVALSLTGELAEYLGISLQPTLFWEYPTIEVLADYLAQKLA